VPATRLVNYSPVQCGGLTRLLSSLGRLGLAVTLALVALAVTRWWPVGASSPLDVRALPLALPAVGFAVLAAISGRARRPTRWRAALAGLGAVVVALSAAVIARGPAGLAGEISGPAGAVGWTAPGPIDLIGRDLRGPALPRRVAVHWAGPLRVPASGRYRLWVEGRGRASVQLKDRPLLLAEGDPLRAEVEIALARGALALDVRFEQTAPGPRLRLGWTRPDGRREVIPARQLGPPLPPWKWWLIDVLAALTAVLLGVLAWLAPWERPRRMPLPRPLSVAELALSAAGYVVLLVIMSWPLARDLAHSGPMDRPDGRLNAWILAWAGQAAWTQPSRTFQAPAFHPLPDVLAFSENLLLPAALVEPLQRWSGPVLAYNLTLLASLLLSGVGVQLLVRRVTGDALAAFVAGAAFAAGPYRWIRTAHLHAQLTVLLPLALLTLDRFWERRTLRRALAVGLLLALQALASIYLGAITAATLAVAIAVALAGGLRSRELGRLALAGLLAALALVPVMRPYLRMRAFEGQEFTLESVADFAATLPSYAAAGTPAWGWATQRLLDPATLRDALFPGLTLLVLGVAGLAAAPRRYRAVAIAASAAAIVLSLGPGTAVYRFLHEHVVLVRGLRALSRFAVVPMLALSVLSGLALAGRRRLLAWTALGLVMVESANLPLRLQRYDGPSPATRWLAGGRGAVLVLPLAEDDTRVMLDGLVHGRPLVNGYSAFLPRPFDRATELFADGLGEEGLRFLRAVGVSHVVSRQPLALRDLVAFPGEHVVAVPSGEAAAVVPRRTPVPTRWTAEGLVVVLPERQVVDRVAFELTDAEWVARPQVEVSADGLRWRAVEATASLADATLSLYRDPRHARGELRLAAPFEVLRLRLDRRLPAREGTLEIHAVR
jgi:hypothetical protein